MSDLPRPVDLSSFALALGSHPYLRDPTALADIYTYAYAKTAHLFERATSISPDQPALVQLKTAFDLTIHHFACRIIQAMLDHLGTTPPPSSSEASPPLDLEALSRRVHSEFERLAAPTTPPASPSTPAPTGWETIEAKPSPSDEPDEEIADYLAGHGSGPDPSSDLLDEEREADDFGLDAFDDRDPNDRTH